MIVPKSSKRILNFHHFSISLRPLSSEPSRSMNGDVKCSFLFCCRHDLVATLYQNVSVNEPRLLPQLEKVLLSFIKEIKQQNAEMENLALAIRR